MKKFVLFLSTASLLLSVSCKKDIEGHMTLPKEIINSISIVDGQQDVSVYDTVSVVSNFYLDSPNILPDGKQVIGVTVRSITLTNQGELVPIQYNVVNKTIHIYPTNTLKDNVEPYMLEISFNTYRYDGGTPVLTETITKTDFIYHFYTKVYNGAAGISESDILRAYPAANQYHYLPKESTEGILTLKPSTKIYINTDRWEHFFKFYRKDSEIFSSSALFDHATNTFTFNTPQDLDPETIYSYALFQKPKGSNDPQQVTTVFQAYFRTSKYSTFREKWNSFVITSPIRWYETPEGNSKFGISFSLEEGFDRYEEMDLTGLIRWDVDSSYFGYQKNKFAYDGLASSGYSIEDGRDPSLNIPPLNAFYVNQNNYLLSSDQIDQDLAQPLPTQDITLISYVGIAMLDDIGSIIAQIYSKNHSTWNSYDEEVYNNGNYEWGIFDTNELFKNVHVQYYVGDKKTSDITFDW